MAKRSKLTPRQRRRDQRRVRELIREGVKVAVVTSPSDGLSLRREIELTRAAVLYADEVELISASAGMLAGVAQLGQGDGANLWALLARLDDETIRALGGTLPAGWREALPLMTSAQAPQLLSLLGMTDAREKLEELQGIVARTTDELRDVGERMLLDAGAHELVGGLNLGIVKLAPPWTADVENMNDLMSDWMKVVSTLLRDSGRRLLFDETMAGIARTLVDEGHVRPHALTLRHAREAAVASGLVARLPAFPQAPLDELLDLRSDLSGPLVRYRSAVSRMAAMLTSRSFDSESAAEIEDLWITEVAPALVEIEEGIGEHGLVREIARTISQDIKTLLREGAALYVGFEALTTMNSWITAAAAVAAPTAQAIATGTVNSAKGQRELSKRDLFYLYEVNRRLT